MTIAPASLRSLNVLAQVSVTLASGTPVNDSYVSYGPDLMAVLSCSESPEEAVRHFGEISDDLRSSTERGRRYDSGVFLKAEPIIPLEQKPEFVVGTSLSTLFLVLSQFQEKIFNRRQALRVAKGLNIKRNYEAGFEVLERLSHSIDWLADQAYWASQGVVLCCRQGEKRKDCSYQALHNAVNAMVVGLYMVEDDLRSAKERTRWQGLGMESDYFQALDRLFNKAQDHANHIEEAVRRCRSY